MYELNTKDWGAKTLIYTLNWFCVFRNFRYHNGFLFDKIPGSESSYKQFNTIEWLKKI